MLVKVKKLVLALCMVAIAHDVYAKPVLLKSEQNISEYQLDNGFKVVLAPNKKENKVYMNTIYFTGSLNDPAGKGGLAHLLEHLAFKGTQNIPDEEFQRLLDQYTLTNNASTDYYSTRYLNVVRPDKTALSQIIRLEAERMDKLVLKEQFVPTEINIVRRERELRLDQPFSVIIDQMWKAAYGNQYFGRLPIGDLDELKSIKMPELEKFYREYYAPNNAVMVVAGNFEIEEILKDIEQNFAPIAARQIPVAIKVPQLDGSKISQRSFSVEKGSDLAKVNMYINGQDFAKQPALALVPYLYTMQPSGSLYKEMVETGVTTGVMSTAWLAQDFNLVFLGAVYSPEQDKTKVESTLINSVEATKQFSESELSRIKNLVKNEQRQMLNNSTTVGTVLSEYIVAHRGNWQQFFVDQQKVQNLTTIQLNQDLSHFLSAQYRVIGDIKPTSADQKQAQQLQQSAEDSQQQEIQTAQPLKDAAVYKQEVVDFVKQSATLLGQREEKIQRGKLNNGMKYAFFPTTTRDDRTYATIHLNFGNEKSLFNQGDAIELLSYLILRGSQQYSFQEIMDHSIALDGQATVTSNQNTIKINISAQKDNFIEYFNYVIDLLKQPKFDQKEFDLIKAQALQSLDRPYTEPEVVANLTLARLMEQYAAGDLRYHFEPEFAKQRLQQANNQQVKEFYQQFFAMNHAQIAITGEFDAKNMQKQLNKSFAHWNSKQTYTPITPQYKQYQAKQIHVLAEQREFGNYQSRLTLPVGAFEQDAAALIVFSHILGNSQLSSRLAQQLREKNALVYGFSSQLNLDDEVNSGVLSISANYKAGRSAQVSEAIHRVFTDLQQNGVTEQELEAAKADILKQRATVLEDERSVHRMLNGQLKLNNTMAIRAQRDLAIAKLTVNDVNQIIKKYLKSDQLIEVMADQYGKAEK